MGNDEGIESAIPLKGSNNKEKMTKVTDKGVQKSEVKHEMSKVSPAVLPSECIFPILGNEPQKEDESRRIVGEEMQWEIERKRQQDPNFVFNIGPNKEVAMDVRKSEI